MDNKSTCISISVFMVALLSLFFINCCDRDEYIDYKYYKENCLLIEVPSDIPPGAKEVYLDENEITNVSSHSFFNLTQCTWLSMSDNKLTHVHVGMFDGLISLEDLILKWDDIKRIDGWGILLPNKMHLARFSSQ